MPDCIEDFSVYIVGRHKQGAMYYDIVVWQGEQNWQCSKRYSEFEQLHRSLLASGFVLPEFPRKSIFSSRFSDSFLDQRQNQLHDILRSAVAADPRLTNPTLRNFLGLPSHMTAPSIDYARELPAPSAPALEDLLSPQALQGSSSSPVAPVYAQAAPTVQASSPQSLHLAAAWPWQGWSSRHLQRQRRRMQFACTCCGNRRSRRRKSHPCRVCGVCAQPLPVQQVVPVSPPYVVPAQRPTYATWPAPAFVSSPMSSGQVVLPCAVYPSPGMDAPYAVYTTSAAHHCHGHGRMPARDDQGHGMLAAGVARLSGGMLLASAL
eukprot:TRINITY_DN2756_c0_g1_i1.p1 TRINITY_DN2756_c0_g1~~TRINITY_DN2756_c0_g1_i1.p1  ORF type:complete len:320 (+),score=26.80 TRINITY_DN2756_c0_g1_i1:63-1022(+)